jgi:carboxyl-terminal processing protease
VRSWAVAGPRFAVAAATLLLLLGSPARAQGGADAPTRAATARVRLVVASEPGESSVFVRYGDKPEGRFLGRTPAGGAPLELDVEAGPAEVVVVKDGFVCKVEPLELRSGSSARLEVRLTPDVHVPRDVVLKGLPSFVKDPAQGEELYVALLAHVVRSYVEEKDPRKLVDGSVDVLVGILNAVRSRELLLRRELPADARRRYYPDELDLSGYPPLALTRTPADAQGRSTWSLAAGGVAVEGATDGDLDSHLAVLQKAWAFVKHQWDARRVLSDAVITSCLVEGLIEGLDDKHTHFLSPTDVEEMSEETQGAFGGVGLVVGLEDGVLTVKAPMDGSPAARAGIKKGDVIVSIDGQPTERMKLQDAVKAMRGEVDSPVELVMARGDKRMTMTVVRARVALKTVASRLLPGDIGLVRITSFMHEGLHDEVQAALEQMKAKGMKALVIDLRNNPGGLLEEAYTVADLFVPADGVVVSTRSRIGAPRVLRATSGQKWTLPIAVLVDATSASASEILAGVLRDHRLATLVGQKTFGKGSVQRVLPLDPYGCALALTVATYHLPNGATPHKVGVTPDVLVELPEDQTAVLLDTAVYGDSQEKDAQLEAASALLRERLAVSRPR